MGIVHHLQHTMDVLLVDDDAGQAEHRPRRIVGMDGHIDAVFVAGGHDGLEEILEVIEQRLVVHALIDLEQRLDVLHALRLPAGQNEAVGRAADGVEHILGVQAVDVGLIVGQHGGAVIAGLGQIGARPVEHGHEVVAHHVDALFAQRGQGFDIIFDVHIAGGQAGLDVVVHVDALNAADLQAGRLDLLVEGVNGFARPGLAGLGGVEGGDDALHAGDLTNLLQSDAVMAGAVPAERHFHKKVASCVIRVKYDRANFAYLSIYQPAPKRNRKTQFSSKKNGAGRLLLEYCAEMCFNTEESSRKGGRGNV